MFWRSRFMAPLALAAAAAACADGPTPTVTEPPTAERAVVSNQIADVRAVDVDLPPEPRPWDTSAAAPEEAIVAQDGHAVIGFKAPGAPRAMTTGRREAVPEAAIRDALDLLEQRGVTVLEYYWLIGGAHVQLPPGVATTLREDSLIDYIEPRQQWYERRTRPSSRDA